MSNHDAAGHCEQERDETIEATSAVTGLLDSSPVYQVVLLYIALRLFMTTLWLCCCKRSCAPRYERCLIVSLIDSFLSAYSPHTMFLATANSSVSFFLFVAADYVAF